MTLSTCLQLSVDLEFKSITTEEGQQLIPPLLRKITNRNDYSYSFPVEYSRNRNGCFLRL